METTKDMQALLEKLEQQNAKQLKLTHMICVFCAILVVMALLVGIFGVVAAAKMSQLIAPLSDMLSKLEAMGAFADTLADADLGALADALSSFTADGPGSLTEALNKLQSFDIDALNESINGLKEAVEGMGQAAYPFG